MFLVALVSITITTAANGDQGAHCSTVFPCGFRAALERVNRSRSNLDSVVVIGPAVETEEDLLDFRDLVELALKTNHVVIGENVVVNGSRLESERRGYMVIEGAERAQIRGFTFTGFETSVMNIRTMERGTVADCHFIGNRASGGLGIVSFGFGKLKILRCSFVENTVRGAAIFQSFTTEFDMEDCRIERNCVEEGPEYPVMLLSNSVCDFKHVVIRNNVAKHGPLMKLLWRSFVNMYISTIEENENTDVICCEGVFSMLMFETEIRNNKGTVFRDTSRDGEFMVESSLIANNSAGDKPLVHMNGGKLAMNTTTVLVGNSGRHLVMSSAPIRVNAVDFHLHNNTFTDSVFCIDETSDMVLLDASFINNSVHDSVIRGSRLSLSLSRVNFDRNTGSVIQCSDCSVSILSSSFVNSESLPVNISSAANRTTYVIGSQFMNRVGAQIEHSGRLFMTGVRFSSRKNEALIGSGTCWFCEYGQTTLGCYDIRAFLCTYACGLALVVYLCWTYTDSLRRFYRHFLL